jgi:anti-sigma regulatory factor (Ser/Thr protein kinase)
VAEFGADVHSPQAARAFVDARLQRWGCDHLVEIAQVLVSELVTNAVVHAGTDCTLRVSLVGGLLRVGVTDRSAAPVQVQEYTPGATSGRGLMIVDALADGWGVEAGEGGKTVWFEVGG